MIIYSHKEKFNIFEDYLIGLIREGDQIKLWKANEEIIIDDEHDIVIFIQIIPNQYNEIILNNTKNINVFVLNTEQMSHNFNKFIFNISGFLEYRKTKNITFGICDYSMANIEFFKSFNKLDDIPIHYIPYQYSKNDIMYLEKYKNPFRKVCTTGGMSERRLQIINELFEDHCLEITKVFGFREYRDKQLATYKILLNISTFEDFTIYEHIRCDRLIFSGMLIISEKKTNYETLDISDYIVWCDKDNIGDTIYNVLENYEKYSNNHNKEKLQNIIKNRQNIYNDFRSKYYQK